MSATRIVIFSKAPVAGLAKTRLIPALGPQGAAAIARAMLERVVAEALRAGTGPVELCVTPAADDAAWQDFRPAGIEWTAQGDGDLGQRMARAASRVLARGEAVLLVGSDCPGLDADALRRAARQLATHDACLTPTHDGGYVLLGLRRSCGAVFADMPWSTNEVAAITAARLDAAGFSVARLPLLHDIDEPSDLVHLPPGLLPGRRP